MKIVFYLGYANLTDNIYGSELAVIKLAIQFKKLGHSASIFYKFSKENPVTFTITEDEYLKNKYDVLIISRYINFYVYYPVNAAKVFLWLHEDFLQSSFAFKHFPNRGEFLLDNVHFDKIICQTEWHKNNFIRIYPNIQVKDKIKVLGNGIDTDTFLYQNIEKVPYRFIWASCPLRGLDIILKLFPKIRELYPQAHLMIFRGPEAFTPEQFQKIESMKEYIFYKGVIDNKSIATEFMKSEMWFYPTNVCETFCICALEAQMAKCLCVCSALAGLNEVVGDNGILLHKPYGSDEYLEECIEGVKKSFENKDYYISKGFESAKQLDWKKRAEEWIKMF